MAPPLTAFGWDDHWSRRFDEVVGARAGVDEPIDGAEPGRVVRHDGAGLMVALAEGPVRAMFGPTVDPAPVVGDWVVVDRHRTPIATLPRDSLLRRRAAGGDHEQPLVANVDLVLAVCGLDRPVRIGRLRRTMTLANDAGAESLVVLTKADVVGPEVPALAEVTVAEADPRLEVITLSAKGGWGIEDLLTRIGTRTVALIGESGAGKSTLVNALLADEVMLEGDVRGGDAKGRHTTTHRELHLLPTGAVLVDTPGIREVGLVADAEAVAETFADVDEVAAECRFNDCAHRTEPGCAVLAAVEAGELAAERVEAWRAYEAEAASAELRADPVASRRAGRQFGRMAKEVLEAKERSRRR